MKEKVYQIHQQNAQQSKKATKNKKMTLKQKSKNNNYNLVNRKHNTFLSFFIGSGMSNFVCS